MDPELERAYDHCRRIAHRSRSSFVSAFWLADAPRARALYAVYAFCRLADDIADDPEVSGDRSLLLARWREELNAIYDGKSEHPVGIAMSDAVKRFDLPMQPFSDLLQGVAFDLSGEAIRSFEDLYRYCYCVASTIGITLVTLFGCRGRRSVEYAVSSGIAVQLTNILRDVAADARTGRVYLPAEDLEKFGVAPADLALETPPESVRLLLAFHAERARCYYERAEQLLPPDHFRRLGAARAMTAIYRHLLEELHRSGFASGPEGLRLSRAKRLRLAAGAWLGWSGRRS